MTGQTAVRKDLKNRPKETIHMAKEGTHLGLPCGFLGEETEKNARQPLRRDNQSRRE